MTHDELRTKLAEAMGWREMTDEEAAKRYGGFSWRDDKGTIRYSTALPDPLTDARDLEALEAWAYDTMGVFLAIGTMDIDKQSGRVIVFASWHGCDAARAAVDHDPNTDTDSIFAARREAVCRAIYAAWEAKR